MHTRQQLGQARQSSLVRGLKRGVLPLVRASIYLAAWRMVIMALGASRSRPGQMLKIEPNRDLRAPAGRCLNAQMSVRQSYPLVDAPQPQAASALTLFLEIESLSIVGDRQDYLVSGTAQNYGDLARACMLCDVAQRLLGDSIQAQGNPGVDDAKFGSRPHDHPDGVLFRELFTVNFQGGHKPHVFQDARVEVVRDFSNIFGEFIRAVLQFCQSLLKFNIALCLGPSFEDADGD